MRYLRIEWIGKEPDSKEIYSHIRNVLGITGFVLSKFCIVEGLIACDRKWVDRVRGALAIRWQFRVLKISGTKKKALEPVK